MQIQATMACVVRVQLRHLRADNSLIVGFSHTFDRVNNKRTEEKLHATRDSELYRYDSAYRLVKFDRGMRNGTKDTITMPSANIPLHSNWSLDGVGNWDRVDGETRQHSSFNEIMQRSGSGGVTALQHDDNGNQTDDGTLTFTWDYRNRLRTVMRKAGNALIAVYSYDALGRRIRKVVTNSGALNGTTDFYLSGWREIEERNANDALTQQYVYGIYIDEPLVTDRNLDGNNTATDAGDQRLFYHQNTLFSVFALTDTNGRIVEGHHYDAYGRQTVFEPGANGVLNFGGDDVIEPGGMSALSNPYLYTGRRLDGETERWYYRNRYLDETLGRFASQDPLGNDGGLNLYQAFQNGPTRWSDWNGEAPRDPTYDLPREFWNWAHQQLGFDDLKGPDGLIPRDVAEEFHDEWETRGRPETGRGRGRGQRGGRRGSWQRGMGSMGEEKPSILLVSLAASMRARRLIMIV